MDGEKDHLATGGPGKWKLSLRARIGSIHTGQSEAIIDF